MLSEIIQGDNGTVLDLTIQDDNRVIDITNTTVEVVIKYKDYRILKQAQITDGENGRCRIILDSADIQNDGAYYFQGTVIFPEGKTFSSSIHRFNVGKRIGYIPNPPPSGGGNGNFSNVTDSTINGNIIVNSIEVKVYDDTIIKADIDNLKISQHTHTNETDLDRLGVNENAKLTIDGIEQANGTITNISDSTTNGNILVDGNEISIYDDSTLKTDVEALKTSDVFTRIGINANGNITIDGVEVAIDDPTSPIDGGTFTTVFNANIVDGGEF